MVQIKRNSREFADVWDIFESYRKKPARKRSILLYALKPTEPLSKRVLINALKENADVLYDLHYNNILEYFSDRGEKLYREKDKPLYFWKSSPSSDWLKLPFELTGAPGKKALPLRRVR
jgi:hypothetical protein